MSMGPSLAGLLIRRPLLVRIAFIFDLLAFRFSGPDFVENSIIQIQIKVYLADYFFSILTKLWTIFSKLDVIRPVS